MKRLGLWGFAGLMLFGSLLLSVCLGQADTWSIGADMPTARNLFSIHAVGGKIYTVGGRISPLSTTSVVEAYDTGTDTWSSKAYMPTSRSIFGASVVGGKIYVIGGMQVFFTSLPTVEIYDTGFVLDSVASVDSVGKLEITWGTIKQGM